MRDVAQEEDAVSRSQRQRILPFAQVHPAAAVQDQMETGARPPAGAGRRPRDRLGQLPGPGALAGSPWRYGPRAGAESGRAL
ncbi:hypothetical protein G6F68_017854 [Rhizopus microsporus]|nr:hypothetical protein G6F68_017854 [Rhizopus microsporus]